MDVIRPQLLLLPVLIRVKVYGTDTAYRSDQC